MTREQSTHWVQFYVANNLAVTWTEDREGPGAKRVTRKDWQNTPTLAGEINFLAGKFAHSIQRANPAVVCGASGLVSIDCDDAEAVERFLQLGAPPTFTVSSSGEKRHFHFRAPADVDYHFFEFAAGTVKAKTTQYLLLPPALHPSGETYTALNGTEIAKLPRAVYEELLRLSNVSKRRVADAVATPGEKVPVGSRHDFLHENVWKLANAGLGLEAIVAGIVDLNANRLEEPLLEEEVERDARRSYQGFLEKADPPRLVKAQPWTGEAPRLAACPNLLDEFSNDLTKLGVAGEVQLTQLTYLALTSRVLPWGVPGERPVSVIAKGTSSSGKSFAVGAVIKLFPEDAVLTLTSSSRLYLLYQDKPLSHRFIYVPEWTTLKDDEDLISILRTLVSEGHINHGTVEGQGRKEARELVKEGPTGLLMTTTAAVTDPELETRCQTLRTDDSPQQTREVFRAIAAAGRQQGEVNLQRWHDLQRWLEAQPAQVDVPYAEDLAELMPNTTVRMRRDFTTILCLVRAHALLHQRTRKRGRRGVEAAFADYGAVRDLVESLLAEEADAHAPEALHETVEAVREIITIGGKDHATIRDVSERLKVGRQAAGNRVRRALSAGYLLDVSSTRGYKLQVGAALPEDTAFLPTVDDVAEHYFARERVS
jgi:hypothetical protein